MNYKANDRSGIYLSHENEIRELSKKLKFHVDDIVSAIQEVGFNEEEIEEYIRDRRERSL
jgi:DNA-binding transcriptional regulator YhcF (GntR family)